MYARLALSVALTALGGCGALGDDDMASIAGFNVTPEPDCTIDPESHDFTAIGEFDISPGAAGACDQAYRIHALIPGKRSVSSGAIEVRLQTTQGQLIFFDRFDTPLPNPFIATFGVAATSAGDRGVVLEIDLIPRVYANQLQGFDGMQLLAEVHVDGVGDFSYPVEICDGCMTVCASALDAPPQGVCDDGAGADGRLCIDPDC